MWVGERKKLLYEYFICPMKLKQQLDCASLKHMCQYLLLKAFVCEIMFYLLFSPTAGGCSAYLSTHLFRLHHPGHL